VANQATRRHTDETEKAENAAGASEESERDFPDMDGKLDYRGENSKPCVMIRTGMGKCGRVAAGTDLLE
jgi:hypothetical protein